MSKATVLMMALVMAFIVCQNNNEALGAEFGVTEAYTMNYCNDEWAKFAFWDPIGFYVTCEVVADDPTKEFSVVIKVKSELLEENIIEEYEGVTDGDTVIFEDFRAIDDSEELGPHNVNFKAVLKLNGVEKASYERDYEVSIQAEPAEFTCINEANTHTMNYCKNSCDKFGIWDPIGFQVACEVHGNPQKTYKLVIGVKAKTLGEKIVKKYKNVRDGDTVSFQEFRVIDGSDDFEQHAVEFKAKLKAAGELLDVDTYESSVDILEDPPEFTCYPPPPPEEPE